MTDRSDLIEQAILLLAELDPHADTHSPNPSKPPLAARLAQHLSDEHHRHDPDLIERLHLLARQLLIELQRVEPVGPMSKRGILNAANTLQLLDHHHQTANGRWSAKQLREHAANLGGES